MHYLVYIRYLCVNPEKGILIVFCCQEGKFYKRTCDVWFLHIEKFGIKKWRDHAFQCSEHATKTKRDQHHEE